MRIERVDPKPPETNVVITMTETEAEDLQNFLAIQLQRPDVKMIRHQIPLEVCDKLYSLLNTKARMVGE